MTGIHVFVICCAEYENIVEDCIESIKKYVDHDLLSINVVSNLKIQIDGVNLILDHEYWKKLDPSWHYRQLYNANWTKQQIFKINVDQYVSGNVLVVDAEVLFLKKMKWINNNKNTLYSSLSPIFAPYFVFNKKLLNLDKMCDYSLIADTMMFSTDILKSMRADIEKIHQRPWLDVINTLVIENGHIMAEFETYGNYVLKHYPESVNVVGPITHLINMYDREDYSFDELLAEVRQRTNNSFISVNIETHSYTTDRTTNSKTAWLSFYEQIRDPTWPDCDHESDFKLLPKYIQKECIEVFGYRQKFDL